LYTATGKSSFSTSTFLLFPTIRQTDTLSLVLGQHAHPMPSNDPVFIPVMQYGNTLEFDGVGANTGLDEVGAEVEEGGGFLEDVCLARI
jgi:hypothetical protein